MSLATVRVEPATDRPLALTRRQLEEIEKIREAGRTEARFILSLVEGVETRKPRRDRTIAADPQLIADEPVALQERPEFIATPVVVTPSIVTPTPMEPLVVGPSIVTPTPTPMEPLVVGPSPVVVAFSSVPPIVTSAPTAPPLLGGTQETVAVFATTFPGGWASGSGVLGRLGSSGSSYGWLAGRVDESARVVDGRSQLVRTLQGLRESTFLRDTIVGQVVVPMLVLIVVLGLLLAVLG